MSAGPPEGFAPHFRKSPVTDAWEPLYSRKQDGVVQIGLTIRAAHCNSRGLPHGGVIATLADNAMGLSCGTALPQEASLACGQCGAILAVSRLAEAHERVAALGPALRAHVEKPAPDVVKRRLEALEGDLPRRREWAAQMQAEANEVHRGVSDAQTPPFDLRLTPLRALLIAAALLLAWRYW